MSKGNSGRGDSGGGGSESGGLPGTVKKGSQFDKIIADSSEEVYLRGTNMNPAKEIKDNAFSYEPIQTENAGEFAKTQAEAERFLPNAGLRYATVAKLPRGYGGGSLGTYGAKISGLNATTKYASYLQGHQKYIYLFKGENLGRNSFDDGNIVKPSGIVGIYKKGSGGWKKVR